VAIQEAAQDEKYDFDSSWLPWDDDDASYKLFSDQKAASLEKELKENQPGILLFRKTVHCLEDDKNADRTLCRDEWEKGDLSRSYREGLLVFVVGEEATEGVHKQQFRNAVAWIDWLQRKGYGTTKGVGILGPTFSGSLPSLAQLLSESESMAELSLPRRRAGESGEGQPPRLPVFSGSVSGKDAAETFQNTAETAVNFHSFVRDDEEILNRFLERLCFEQPRAFDPRRVAVISEDETAYGQSALEGASTAP